MSALVINQKTLSPENPSYFIADISANHDGSLDRAKALIALAAEAGADAAKFQNFTAEEIVSETGFRSLGSQVSHQSKWKKSVTEVYRGASIPWDWTPVLAEECRRRGIDYFSSPYDTGAADMLEPHVPAYKIGSGDITWLEFIDVIAAKGKPVLLASGASTLEEVRAAVAVLRRRGVPFGLFQCNTNYTGSLENFDHIHLNVLPLFAREFPDAVLGLSDHTPGHATVLGAVALGARLVEKHFTDDPSREGPDHPFSMTPQSWREMVDRTRELERALGAGEKFVAGNERETVVIQRRAVRTRSALKAGTRLTRAMLAVLRPAPPGAYPASEVERLIGAELTVDLAAGDALTPSAVRLPTP